MTKTVHGFPETKGATLEPLRETSGDIPDDTRAGFINWVGELHVHLDNLDEWVGVSSVLKEVRLVTADLTMDQVTEITDEVHAACFEFDKKDFKFYLWDKELYAYLWRRPKQKLTAIANEHKEWL